LGVIYREPETSWNKYCETIDPREPLKIEISQRLHSPSTYCGREVVLACLSSLDH
jgi:hypothetical protein